MSDEQQRKPSFNIIAPNPLLGNKTLVIMNPEMTRGLCDFIEKVANEDNLDEQEQYLYALAKRLRAHFYDMRKMYSGSQEVESNIEPVSV